ncbi:hypothetical protein PS15m_000901 [Mucor circinelloides]
MYLEPTSKHVIPVHPSSTEGWATQKLSVDKHEFLAGKKSNRKVAYLWSHSNGFHKESLHPLMRRFKDHLRSLREYDQTDITFISWDARNHGDSARLNENKLYDSYRWSDNAMDTKQVIDEFQLNTDYDQFIGVGHSFGATSMILCEYYYPGTFDGLCVIEPVLSSVMYDGEIKEQFPVLASRKRRDEWPSFEECHKSLASRGFFKLLHPEVLELYVKYGMYQTDKGTVKLKCPREQEYLVFKFSQFDNFVAMKSLEVINIPIHFIYALESTFMAPEDAATVVDRNAQRITLDFVEGTHMVPNEKPDIIVPHIMKLTNRVNKEGKSAKSKL